MSRIDRYIFRAVLGAAMIALLVLLGLETFFTLLTELADVGTGDYGTVEMLRYLLLSTPQRIYQAFPMALLLGGLLGMGALAQSSELVAMRAAGFSLLRLVLAALQAGLLLGLVGLGVGEFLAPDAQYAAEELRAVAKSQNKAIRRGRGFWARDGNHFVNVRGVLPGVRLDGISIYELDDTADLKSVVWADWARYHGDRWVLVNVRRSVMEPERVVTETREFLQVESVITPGMLDVLAADPDELAIRDLRVYSEYLSRNGLDAGEYRLAFWTKLLGPISSLAMLFIAMPFVFAPQRSAGVGQRLVVGIILGLLFYLGNRLLGNVVLLYGLPPLVGAALPSLLFFGAGAWLLSRQR